MFEINVKPDVNDIDDKVVARPGSIHRLRSSHTSLHIAHNNSHWDDILVGTEVLVIRQAIYGVDIRAIASNSQNPYNALCLTDNGDNVVLTLYSGITTNVIYAD